jgi:hypothetical protein
MPKNVDLEKGASEQRTVNRERGNSTRWQQVDRTEQFNYPGMHGQMLMGKSAENNRNAVVGE